MQVFADKATNSIVISSTKPAYVMLEAVMRGLDTKRNQVFVEAVILEVGVDRLRQIGSDPVQVLGAGKFGSVQGLGGFNRTPEDIAAIAQILSGAGTGGTITVLDNLNVRAFLQLVMTMSDTNILSTPQVLATDNQKAKIVVGENRPFPTGQAQGITGGTLVTIERKDVGVTLEMTPQVLDDGLIRIEMKQEITAIAENVAQTIGAGAATIPVGRRRLNGRWKRLRWRRTVRPSSWADWFGTILRSTSARFPYLAISRFSAGCFAFRGSRWRNSISSCS